MKKRKNSITKLIACVLVLTLSLTIIQPLSVFAQQDISSPETKPEKWIPSKEDMQLPNTAGDLTIEQLETAKLSAEDIPEFITDKEIKGKGHVNRLREQEPDDNTVVFQNRDGTKTAYFFSSPVKYTDENGKTKDKHTKLESKNIPSKHSEKYGYVNQKNNIKTYFPKQMTSEQGMLLESEDISVELLPLDATEEKYVLQNGSKVSPGEYFSKNKTATKTFSSSSVSDDVAKIQNKKITAKKAAANKVHITEEFTDDEKDTIQYDDVFGSETTLRYSSTFNGLKEDIILYENTGINNFRFKLKTNGLSLVCNEHGEYYLADPLTGENFVAISELLIYDSNNKVYKNDYAHEYNHYYEAKTIKPDEEYILSVVVDEEFLNSPDTVYPVYIDPTMTVVDKGLVDDATLYSKSEERATSGQVKIGYNGTTYGTSRGLYNFPITKFNMDFILMYGNQIESADLNLYALQYGNSSSYDDAKKLSMYQFDSPWTYYTVKWKNTDPDNYSKLIDTVNVTYGWTAFDISYIIDKFKTDSDYTTDFNGVIIKANSETASTWKKFVSSWGTSSKQPYISITYNDSPSACSQVVSGATYYLKNYNGEYLDVYNKGTSDNTRLLTYAFNGNTNQQFKITYISGGEYEIAPQHTSGKVLSVNSSKQVILEEDSNASRQRWYIFYREGKYHIVNKKYNTAVMAPTYDSDYISINNEYGYCCWELERITINLTISDSIFISQLVNPDVSFNRPGSEYAFDFQKAYTLLQVFNEALEERNAGSGTSGSLVSGEYLEDNGYCEEGCGRDLEAILNRMYGLAQSGMTTFESAMYQSEQWINQLNLALSFSFYNNIFSNINKPVKIQSYKFNLDSRLDSIEYNLMTKGVLYNTKNSSITCTSLNSVLPANITNTYTGAEANAILDLKQPPYDVNLPVNEITFTRDISPDEHVLVRMFKTNHNSAEGAWVALYDDVVGLTPAQLKQKYALDYEPNKFVFVGAERGNTVRYGVAGTNAFGNGGGMQFDSVGFNYWIIGKTQYDISLIY